MARQTREGRRISDELLDELLAGDDTAEVFRSATLLDALKKAVAERALDAETDAHLEHESASGNHRNGHNRKRVLTDEGAMELAVPRDRAGRFDPRPAEPQAVVAKYHRHPETAACPACKRSEGQRSGAGSRHRRLRAVEGASESTAHHRARNGGTQGNRRELRARPPRLTRDRLRGTSGAVPCTERKIRMREPKALTFDVFGTVVDWRTSIAREGRAFGERHGIETDWDRFADDWRGLYQPSLARVRDGERPWTRLDDLHRESLRTLLERRGVVVGKGGVSDASVDEFNRAWHRLDPWPDAVEGLTRLKRRYVLATLSNGNVALLVNMAKRAGLPWDAVLGAEVARRYKPQPDAYLTTADLLGLSPGECMMVAAHNDDLRAAGSLGFRTAFVRRPAEHGPDQVRDVRAEDAFDVVANDFIDLAEALGA